MRTDVLTESLLRLLCHLLACFDRRSQPLANGLVDLQHQNLSELSAF
jgi:hypothetical protein